MREIEQLKKELEAARAESPEISKEDALRLMRKWDDDSESFTSDMIRNK